MSLRESSTGKSTFPIIVHSHLRWDWVWQRPQQFLSRFSKTHPILFVEGPHIIEGNADPRARWRRDPKFPNVVVMHTEFSKTSWDKMGGASVDIERYCLLRQELDSSLKSEFGQSSNKPVQWFYDPMAAPAFIGRLNERANVYDCMDELSQFKGAPPEMIERERFLLSHADVVFAGGRKMWESKSRFNKNSHFYGCGVDVSHFASARKESTPFPADVAKLSGPTLGYFGVIDERLDYELIGKLAAANAHWNICMVGPVCKVDANDFPQRKNLHWMGGREYSDLPAYTKKFDVCLMPFAMNEATEFINPTKALEYMATATPIVSSPVPDVVSNFSSVVQIADTHDKFISHCRQALQSPDQSAIERGLQMASENTWEAIVAKMENHIAQALETRIAAQREKITISPLPAAAKGVLPSAAVASSQVAVPA